MKHVDEVAAGIVAHTDDVAHELAQIAAPGSEQTMLSRQRFCNADCATAN